VRRWRALRGASARSRRVRLGSRRGTTRRRLGGALSRRWRLRHGPLSPRRCHPILFSRLRARARLSARIPLHRRDVHPRPPRSWRRVQRGSAVSRRAQVRVQRLHAPVRERAGLPGLRDLHRRRLPRRRARAGRALHVRRAVPEAELPRGSVRADLRHARAVPGWPAVCSQRRGRARRVHAARRAHVRRLRSDRDRPARGSHERPGHRSVVGLRLDLRNTPHSEQGMATPSSRGAATAWCTRGAPGSCARCEATRARRSSSSPRSDRPAPHRYKARPRRARSRRAGRSSRGSRS
jgi:hypothetical protein